jgi:hypothetical protein
MAPGSPCKTLADRQGELREHGPNIDSGDGVEHGMGSIIDASNADSSIPYKENEHNTQEAENVIITTEVILSKEAELIDSSSGDLDNAGMVQDAILSISFSQRASFNGYEAFNASIPAPAIASSGDGGTATERGTARETKGVEDITGGASDQQCKRRRSCLNDPKTDESGQNRSIWRNEYKGAKSGIEHPNA